MSDNKEKTGVAVRVPEWVLDEIEEQIRSQQRPRPTRGELLARAWGVYRSASIANNGQSESPDLGRGKDYQEGGYDSIFSTSGTGTVVDMLTALIVAGRKSEVDAILRLIRTMFESGKRERAGESLPKTGHADFDRAAEAFVHNAQEFGDSEPDLSQDRRKRTKRPA